ncbi:GNAT family N-acetyltransferase [Streptomyces sp. NPDC054854]
MTSTAAPCTTAGPHIHSALTPDLLAHPLLASCPHLYCSPRWLSVEEQAHPGQRFYVSVRDTDENAFAPVYGFDQTSNPWPFARPDLFLADALGDKDSHHVLLPSFTIGGRRPGHSRFYTGGPAYKRAALLTRILDRAATEASHRGAAVLAALYCLPQDADLAHAFRQNGGIRFPSHGTNILGLSGHTYEDWLAGLPRKQRAKEQADTREVERAGIDISVKPLHSTDVDWIVPLELDLYAKHGHAYAAREATALHKAYIENLGTDALVVQATLENRPVGFVSLIRHGRSAYVRQAGFDAKVAATTPLHFATAMQQPIRWAYTHGVTRLDLSISADNTKQHRGAVTCARDAWFIPLTDGAQAHLARASQITQTTDAPARI